MFCLFLLRWQTEISQAATLSVKHAGRDLATAAHTDFKSVSSKISVSSSFSSSQKLYSSKVWLAVFGADRTGTTVAPILN